MTPPPVVEPPQFQEIETIFPSWGIIRPRSVRIAYRAAKSGTSFTFFESAILVTNRSKRWNGNLDTLPVEYLKDVMAKMLDYGDRVQFSLVSGGPQPSYQITNDLGKHMAFDRNHHLLRPEEHEFAGANASPVVTLEQVKARIAGIGANSGSSPRAARVVRAAGGTRTSAAKLNEQFAAQRYEYFRNNRQMLPPSITEHSDEITELMRNGKSAEEAFNEVVKKYF